MVFMIRRVIEELYVLENLLKESGFLFEDFKTAEAAFLSQGIEKGLIKSYFEKFKEIKTKNKIKDSKQKNIDLWAKEDFGSFKEFVDSLYVQQTNKEIRKNIKMTGAEKIAENEAWVVYHVKDHKACVSYGAGTKWCITSPSGSEFDSYSQNNNFYFILSKTREDSDPLYKIAMLVNAHGEITYFDAEDNEFDSIKGLKVPKFKYEIPEQRISVDGKLYSLSEFQSLKSLKVGGGLDLRRTAIKTLPANLKVGGGLDLRRTPIQTLPANLEVGGDLYLNDTPIKSLPDNLKVGGEIIGFSKQKKRVSKK